MRFKMIALILVMVITLIGCSSKNNSSAGSSAASSDSAAPSNSASTGKTIELTFWHMQNQPDAKAAFQQLLDDFMAENKNIHITQQIYNWSDAKTKLTTAISAGTPPDIMHTTPDFLVSLMDTRAVKPVDDIVQEIDAKHKIYHSQLKTFQSGGKTMAIPFFSQDILLYYRKDLFEKANLKPPTNWDEMLHAAQVLTKDGNYGVGVPLSNSMYTDQVLYDFMVSNNGNLYDENGNITFNSKENIEALDMLKKLSKFSPKDSTNWVWEDANNALAQGKIAMIFQFGHMPSWWASQNPKNPDALGAVMPPLGPSGKNYSSITYPNGLLVFSEGEKREAAKKFLEFLSMPVNNAKLFTSMSPGLLLPVLDTTATSDEYNKAPGIVKYQDIIKLAFKANENGKLFGFSDAKTPPASVGPISGQTLMGMTVQKMILQNLSAEDAAKWGQAEMEKVAAKYK